MNFNSLFSLQTQKALYRAFWVLLVSIRALF